MATKDRVTIELYVDDQGTVKIINARKAVEDLGQAGKKGGDEMASGLQKAGDYSANLASQLGSVLGITLSVAGAAYMVEKGFSAWKNLIAGGIGMVDDYQKKIVGTSYILTTMSDVPAPDLSKAYGQWKEYFAWLYQQSLEADKKSAASAQEIFGVSVELAKKGVIAASKEEMDTIGRLTDLMKAVTPTYASLEQQARGEIEAMMSGTTRLGAQTALILAQIDPAFKKNIASAREQNTELEYLRSLLPQIKQYTTDLMGTWNAVSASLKSAWQVINLQAFGDAHRDVVGFAQQLGDRLVQNGQLTKEGEAAAAALGVAWSAAKGQVAGLLDYVINNGPEVISNVKAIASGVGAIGGAAISSIKWVSNLIQELNRASENPLIGALLGAGAGRYLGLGPWGMVAGGAAGFVAAGQRGNEAEVARGLARAQKEFEGYETPGEGLGLPYAPPGAPPRTPKTRRPPGGQGTGGGAGGGAGRDTSGTLESLIMQLRQEQAKLTEGAFAGIDAAYEKTVSKIRKLAMDEQQLREGMLAADEWREAKKQKVVEDFNLKHLRQMHQTTALQIAEDEKRLDSVQGNLNLENQVREEMDVHAVERAQKLALAEQQQAKGYYDSLAQSSVLIADQIAWKEKAWQLEKEISRTQLEQWFIGKDISAAHKDDYRQLLALTNQAKEYNLARQKAVDLGTLEGWAIERAGDVLKRGRSTIKDMLSGAESFGADTLGQAATGTLAQDNKSAKEFGKTAVQSMILEMNKRSFTQVWNNIAKLLEPKTPSSLGAGGVGALGGSTGMGLTSLSQVAELQKQAANGSVEAAEQLKNAAGHHRDAAGNITTSAGMTGLSATQLGLSAGGMLLAGIGVATGAQELIYASMVLEAAALLLEIAAYTDMFTFHGGGLVAHTGLLVAHGGLALDERLILAQTGEGIIKRDTMAEYARAGISFDMLNSGRLPLFSGGHLAGPPAPGGGGSTVQDNKQVHFNIAKGAINIIAPPKMTDREAENMVRRQILPALEKVMGNRGRSILD
jgi:hypothetical protein